MDQIEVEVERGGEDGRELLGITELLIPIDYSVKKGTK
jgi:hypothetical protein